MANGNGNGISQTHTLSVLVANKPGVLTHVSGLFSRRGYNIDSLTVGVTENPDISRMTIVAHGDEQVIEQVTKQLNKLIDIIKVVEVTSNESVDRELALIKVAAKAQNRSEVIQIVDIFRAKIIDVSSESVVIEITGSGDKINALEEMMRPFGIKEMVRTGKVALVRGARLTQHEK
jgi:acetolactate synthase I/III small subunit